MFRHGCRPKPLLDKLSFMQLWSSHAVLSLGESMDGKALLLHKSPHALACKNTDPPLICMALVARPSSSEAHAQ